MSFFVLGAGGHAKVVADVMCALGRDIDGFIDSGKSGETVCGRPVFDESSLAPGSHSFVVAIGDNQTRKRLFEQALNMGWEPVTLIHPAAIVSTSAFVDRGTVVFPGAIINASAQVSTNVIVNTASVIEHDCVIGAHTHIAPRSALGGGCRVGQLVLFGIGAIALPRMDVGDGAVVGAGGVVVRNVPAGAKVIGSKCLPAHG